MTRASREPETAVGPAPASPAPPPPVERPEEQPEERPEQRIERFACAKCGAELHYAPGTSHLKCAYCSHINEIETPIAGEAGGIEELDYLAFLGHLKEREETQQEPAVRCEACGAETDRPPDLDAFHCVFCGADIIAAEVAPRVIRPRSLLPFEVNADVAHRKFRQWISSRWFAPGHLKRFSHSDGNMQGVYVPYWTYDSVAVAEYTGERGEHYYVNEQYTTTENGKRVTRTRQVRKTRWHPAAGTVTLRFDDLLVLASTSLPPESAGKLGPWDLANLVPYKNDYVAGFRAERYKIELEEGFGVARRMMEGPIVNAIRSDIGGDEQRIHDVDTRYHEITFKHLLLPVWLSAYRFKGKVYRFLINARTGEVQGARPWSFWKIALAVGAGVLAILIVVLIAAVAR